MRAARRLGASVSALVLSLASAGFAAAPPNPRSLPTLVARWTWGSSGPSSIVIDDGVAYVQARDRAAALDAASGALLWERPFQVKDYEHYMPILVVMDK